MEERLYAANDLGRQLAEAIGARASSLPTPGPGGTASATREDICFKLPEEPDRSA